MNSGFHDLCQIFKKDLLRVVQKDLYASKRPKRSAFFLRLAVLASVAMCFVYIFTFCIPQASSRNKSMAWNARVYQRPCKTAGVDEGEIPYVHYPIPRTFSRMECACNPVRFFAILSMQRSGSGWFETLLNSHINVSSNGEIFGQRERRENISAIENTLDRVFNLDWLSSASKNECSAAVGFKWMLNQGVIENLESIADYFQRNGVHAIFLFRKNSLRRMVSVLANSYDKNKKLLNGTHKSHVHSPAEAKILASYKPKVNTTTLVSDLMHEDAMAARAVAYFNRTRHLVVYYEDVLRNRSKINEVQEFLRLPSRELMSRQIKIHSGPLREQLENFEEVKDALQGTKFQRFLHSDP